MAEKWAHLRRDSVHEILKAEKIGLEQLVAELIEHIDFLLDRLSSEDNAMSSALDTIKILNDTARRYEATIQRVREVCDKHPPGYNPFIDEVRDVLDGKEDIR